MEKAIDTKMDVTEAIKTYAERHVEEINASRLYSRINRKYTTN